MHSPDKILDIAFEFLSKIVKSGDSILAAVSGGSDSVALLYILFELKTRLHLSDPAIAHVNYGLRGEESDQDEKFVSELAKSLGLQLHVKKLGGRSLKTAGVEQWAREELYMFFQSIKKEHDFSFIATGHTMDDQAETILLRLLRGSGLKGLRGILPYREDGVVRPLLGLRREELIEWLKSRNIAYRTDSSNIDTKFRRNWIRHEIIPSLVSREQMSVEHLSSTALKMQNLWDQMKEKINNWIDLFVINRGENYFIIKKEGIKGNPIASEAIRELLELYNISVSNYHIEAVLRESGRAGGQFLLPGNWAFFPQKDSILFENKSKNGNFTCRLNVPGLTVCAKAGFSFETVDFAGGLPVEKNSDLFTAYVDHDKTGKLLIYRTLRDDDEFAPLGRKSEINVMKFLSKQGIPERSRRRTCAVVTEKDNKVVWVVGIRINHNFRITSETKRILKITCKTIGDSAGFRKSFI
jgi:tRNA(Ile)-lysidine synthase